MICNKNPFPRIYENIDQPTDIEQLCKMSVGLLFTN